jgi:hypothetical protein
MTRAYARRVLAFSHRGEDRNGDDRKQLSALRVTRYARWPARSASTASAQLRGAKVARGEPRALSTDDYARLLRMPDLRTTAGATARRRGSFPS